MPKKSKETPLSKTSPIIRHARHAIARTKHAIALKDRLPTALSFDKVDKVIILCLVVVFLGLFIYLLISREQFFAYLTFCALLTLVFVGILRATGLVQTSWIVLGGSAAVFAGLFWLAKPLYTDYLNSEIASLKIKIATLQGSDPAKDILNHYYDLLQKRQFAAAYALVAEARKKERELRFGSNHFANFVSSFENTFGYDNVAVAFEAPAGGDLKYTVSYDATDNVPNNEISERQKQLFSSPAVGELFNHDAIINALIINLEKYSVVPGDKATETIKSYINSRKIEEIFDSLFIAALARELRDSQKIDLKPKQTHPENVNVRGSIES